jgi:pimeloyl-ACP methyl ester carboxylesterase
MNQSNTIHHVHSDGFDLVVEEFGHGQPILFAHGLTSNRAQSRRQMAPLADRYRVIIFDQRGHADSSPVTDPALYDARRMAGDMAAILDALGIDQAVVGGESMGAATALRFAVDYPQRTRALILALPALSDELLAARQMVKDFAPAIRAIGMSEFAGRNEQEMLKAGASAQRAADWTAVLRSHQTESIAVACESVPDWVVCSREDLQALQMPVQIIAVQDDPVHPLELAERLRDTIAGARLILPQPNEAYTENPGMVGAICRDFLAGVL